MEFKKVTPDESISLFVKDILIFEDANKDQDTVLPFFADGYPGLMYQETQHGLLVNPHKKAMPLLFLYGQTINPIELVIRGPYQLITFQLYPFVLKSFFNITPKDVNDNCYDMQLLQDPDTSETISLLKSTTLPEKRIEILSSFLYAFFELKRSSLDFKVSQAIQFILLHKGQLNIAELAPALKLNERTLERRFLNEVGISPKLFSKIIQFNNSLEQLTVKDYTKLSDIVYDNGFSDQSHFIKVFRAFTGKTPSSFIRKKM